MTLYALAWLLLGRRAVAAFLGGLLVGVLLASASSSALAAAREATDGAEMRAAAHARGSSISEAVMPVRPPSDDAAVAFVGVGEADGSPSSGGPRIALPATREDLRPASASPRQDPAAILAVIEAAAREFVVDPARLVALGMCESSLRTGAVGKAQEIGAFQWQPRTWESNAPRLGYTILDITDPVAQARLTALVLREDGGWRWTCAS